MNQIDEKILKKTVYLILPMINTKKYNIWKLSMLLIWSRPKYTLELELKSY